MIKDIKIGDVFTNIYGNSFMVWYDDYYGYYKTIYKNLKTNGDNYSMPTLLRYINNNRLEYKTNILADFEKLLNTQETPENNKEEERKTWGFGPKS